MNALKHWLKDGSDKVKVIVTSVPFAPDSMSDEKFDKWAGFEKQRIQILEHIEQFQISRVVFLSGDVHASLSLELHSPSGLKIISVISSAFFWPYPHPSARHFQRKGTINGGKAGPFHLVNSSRVISDDNFTRLTIKPTDIFVEVFSRKGQRKSQILHKF